MASCVQWWLLLGILAVLATAQEQPQKRAIDGSPKLQFADDVISQDRLVRQSKKPKTTTPKPLGFFGFFGTIKQLIVDQANDTRSAYDQLSKLFGGQFTDSQPSTTPPPITDNSTTTTPPPYRISRAEFLKILDRNLKGLRRLYNLEMREAMADSRKNIQGYQREFHRKLYEQFKD